MTLDAKCVIFSLVVVGSNLLLGLFRLFCCCCLVLLFFLSIKIVEFCLIVATKENEKRFLLICFSLHDYILTVIETAAIKTERKSFIKWNRCNF